MSERDIEQQREIDQMSERKRPATPPRHGPMGHMIPGEKARDVKGTTFKLIRFMGRFKVPFIVAFLFAIGSTVFSIVGPKVLSTATTELFNGIVAKVAGTGGIDFDAIARILIATLGLYVVSALCSFLQGWLLTYVTQHTCYEFRKEISHKIDRLPVGYFERTSTGDTLSRITNDVDTLGQSLNQGITVFIQAVVTLVGVLVMMLTINVPMTIVAVLIIPVSLLVVRVVVKHSQKYFYQQQDRLGAIDGQIEETFSGHAVVKAFNREDASVAQFEKTNDQLYEAAWKSQFLSGLMKPAMDTVGNLAYVVVAIMGAAFAAQGRITVGDIQAFIQYVKNFTHPITQLAQVSNILQQTAAAAERVFEFLEAPEEEPETPRAHAADVDTDMEFDHMRFGYDAAHPVIHDFTAHVAPGQTVALVGPTGAGKTTMVKLIMRFYDVDAGAIRMGGHDLREFSRADVRSQFGMVLQDTWLFNGTVRENIRFGDLDATDEEVEQAARRAHAHHFIETLPGGYDCVIGEDAGNLSLGERQLLTIARAFLANRRMLILDEATSSVDTRTEKLIQQAMDELMVGRTAFVIAHRLSTIKNAHLILVINDGDIIEQGTHDELLAQNGAYADLYRAQFSDAGRASASD
jgi:ATP-binding cassette subfamily B multidrug efflux pump